MDRGRIGALIGHLRHDRFVRGAAAIGLGAAAVSTRAALAQEPTPTPQSFVIIVPTEPPDIDDIAARPTSTPPPPVEPTPTPVPETQPEPEPSPTPEPGDPPTWPPTPTPEIGVSAQPGTGVQEQQFPTDPDNWLCRLGPWFPIIQPPDLVGATGIKWFGVQFEPETGRLDGTAFDPDGKDVSTYSVEPRGGGVQWSLAGPDGAIDGTLEVELQGDERHFTGLINRFSIGFRLSPAGEFIADDDTAVELADGEVRLLEQWSTAMPRVGRLFDVLASNGGGPATAGSPAQCFAAGFLLAPSLVGCAVSIVGCAPAAYFGEYIFSECEE